MTSYLILTLTWETRVRARVTAPSWSAMTGVKADPGPWDKVAGSEFMQELWGTLTPGQRMQLQLS